MLFINLEYVGVCYQVLAKWCLPSIEYKGLDTPNQHNITFVLAKKLHLNTPQRLHPVAN